jgi:peroxisome-assembly ATPase
MFILHTIISGVSQTAGFAWSFTFVLSALPSSTINKMKRRTLLNTYRWRFWRRQPPSFQSQNLSTTTRLTNKKCTTTSDYLDANARPSFSRGVIPWRQFSTIIHVEEVDQGPVTIQLQDMISRGKIQSDRHQLAAARELDRVYHDLMATDPPPLTENFTETTKTTITSSLAQPSSYFPVSVFGSLFGQATTAMADAAANSLGFTSTQHSIPGVYTYGGVGCGKTFLMDLFYHSIDHGPWANDKQMVHYHKFMLNVHQYMHTSRQEQKAKQQEQQHQQANQTASTTQYDLIGPVVHHILQQGRLLCLDEFQVTDVADAMILKELFGRLWKCGCVLVTTSNRPPRDLYLRGLQRDRFVPFIDLLEQRCHVVSLMDNETDYRMMMFLQDDTTSSVEQVKDVETEANSTLLARPKQVYYFGKEHKKQLKSMFHEMTKGRPTNPTTLETQGRKVKIPMACKSKSVCMFSFEDLCQKALGAADYLVIGQQFSTVFLYGIPPMSINELNWLRRFITFVDTMYELKVRLLLQTSTGSLEDIFVVEGDKQAYSQDEVFAFDRTLSRLKEMSTAIYLSSKWMGDKDGTAFNDVTAKLDFELTS